MGRPCCAAAKRMVTIKALDKGDGVTEWEYGPGLMWRHHYGADAITGIEHENNGVCLFDGKPYLVGHQTIQPLLIADQATSVDDQVRGVTQLAVSVLPVTCQSWIIRHQRITASRQTVKQR